MHKSLSALFPLCLCSLAQADGSVYRVVLDGRIQAIATLRANEGQYLGQIYYDASGADGLELSGTPGKTGGFEWNESLWTREDNASKPTGLFTGKLSADGKTGQGGWKSPDGKKHLPLSLTRLARIETLNSPEAGVWVDYPKFDDPRYAKLNALLATEASQNLAENLKSVKELRAELQAAPIDSDAPDRLSATTSCDVQSVLANTVSLLCSLYEYSGGAHGNTGLDARAYAIAADGAVRPLKLWDVLQKSPANINKLSALIVADLKRQKASSVVNGGIKDFVKELDKDAMAFSIVPVGLAFHFSPYEVASYAEGHFRAVIPNRALASLYRPDGPLAERSGKPEPKESSR